MRIQRFVSVIPIVFCIFYAAPLFALPNSSGTWKLDLSKSAIPPGQDANLEKQMIVTHEGDTLSVKNTLKIGEMDVTQALRYPTDGSLNVNTDKIQPEALTRSRAKWIADKLVITGGDETTGHRQIWDLSEEGKILTIQLMLKFQGREIPWKEVYNKVE